MRACPVCGSVKVTLAPAGDSCGNCGNTGGRFPHLHNQGSPTIPGVVIGFGCFWIRPHRRLA